MVPKLEELSISAMQQGGAAEALLHAMKGSIDSMINTAIFFWLHPKTLWRNG
jgi:hypothetical protein